MPRTPFTPKDDEKLRKIWLTATTDELLQAFPGLTLASIRWRAKTLQLRHRTDAPKSKRHIRQGRVVTPVYWSEEEVDTLRDYHAQGYKADKIAPLMQRSLTSVRCKLTSLGVNVSREQQISLPKFSWDIK